MKKLIMILGMLFTLTTVNAKQFCVKINCYYYDNKSKVFVDVDKEINKYLDKGYKLVSIAPNITTYTYRCGYGTETKCYYCIFDDIQR